MPATTDLTVHLEQRIAVVNAALEIGDWAQVVSLTSELYALAVAAGEAEFAELVQDLHWIANDALVRPFDVIALVQP